MEKFSLGLHKVKLNPEVKSFLNIQTSYVLENVGVPIKIVYTKLIFIEPIILDRILYFGYASHLSDIKFGIEINTQNVISFGEFNGSNYYSIINGDIQKLLLCSLSYDFFIQRLISSASLGNYHQHHEKYANLLLDILRDIDVEATQKGAWANLIEEMSLGVI